jgi:hypothetical protein
MLFVDIRIDEDHLAFCEPNFVKDSVDGVCLPVYGDRYGPNHGRSQSECKIFNSITRKVVAHHASFALPIYYQRSRSLTSH